MDGPKAELLQVGIVSALRELSQGRICPKTLGPEVSKSSEDGSVSRPDLVCSWTHLEAQEATLQMCKQITLLLALSTLNAGCIQQPPLLFF